jgi:hypothetical protein
MFNVWSLASSRTGVNIGFIEFPHALGEVISSASDPDSPVDVYPLRICVLRNQNSNNDICDNYYISLYSV